MSDRAERSVRIVVCIGAGKSEPWVRGLAARLPEAVVESWPGPATEGGPATEPADFAVVWSPPDDFYATQPRLKAIFNLGAGVDALLGSPRLPVDVPVIRLEDAGMAPLMAEYVVHAAVRFAREFDRLDDDRRAGRWAPRRPTDRSDYPVGVMGAGALGAPVAQALARHQFPVTVWSRSPRSVDGVVCVAGADALDDFLAATRILVVLLPLTPQTEDIVDRALLGKLLPRAYLINVARGRHVVDRDLLDAIAGGHVAGAALDVFREEPLSPDHPFWAESRITITPHCAAVTQRPATIAQIAAKIEQLVVGQTVGGVVDRTRGY